MSTLKNFLSAGLKGALGMAALFLAWTGVCQAETHITEYPITYNNNELPLSITYGWDGAFWFTEHNANRLGRIETVSNVISQVLITNNYHVSSISPFGIVRGLSPYLWFTEQSAGRIGLMNSLTTNTTLAPNAITTNYVDFRLPNTNSQPLSITIGPDGNVWFIEFQANKLATIPNSVPAVSNGAVLRDITEYSLPVEIVRTNSQLYGLTSGPDGNLWFTDFTWGTINRFTVSGPNIGQVTSFLLTGSNSEPANITVGPDNALWFTEQNSNKIGRLTVDGQLREYPLPGGPNAHLQPYGILSGPDGKIYFTELNNSTVGNITTNGIFTLLPTPSGDSEPTQLATDGTNIWFGEYVGGTSQSSHNRIGKLSSLDAIISLNGPTTATLSDGVTLSTNFGPFTNSSRTNTLAFKWGDGVTTTLRFTTGKTNVSFVNNVTGGKATTTLNLTNTASVTNGTNIIYTFDVYATHTYSYLATNVVTLTITDPGNNMAVENIALEQPSAFFNGSVLLNAGTAYLKFPDGQVFGNYFIEDFPYVYNYNFGWIYFVDANDGAGDAYFYDFTSGHWFYTGPTLWPYLYDFSLNEWGQFTPSATTTTEGLGLLNQTIGPINPIQ